MIAGLGMLLRTCDSRLSISLNSENTSVYRTHGPSSASIILMLVDDEGVLRRVGLYRFIENQDPYQQQELL